MTKGKKIAIISVGAVVVALVITIIILALVQSTFYSPDVTKADEIRVYIDGNEISIGVCTNPENFTDPDSTDPGQEIYTNIMAKLGDNSNESVLTCMLAGAYGVDDYELTKVDTEIATITENDVVVEFSFDTTQTLVVNGEEEQDGDGNTIKYDKIYVVVSDTTDLTETKAYLYNKNNDQSKFFITYLSKQANLYDYIKSIDA